MGLKFCVKPCRFAISALLLNLPRLSLLVGVQLIPIALLLRHRSKPLGSAQGSGAGEWGTAHGLGGVEFRFH